MLQVLQRLLCGTAPPPPAKPRVPFLQFLAFLLKPGCLGVVLPAQLSELVTSPLIHSSSAFQSSRPFSSKTTIPSCPLFRYKVKLLLIYLWVLLTVGFPESFMSLLTSCLAPVFFRFLYIYFLQEDLSVRVEGAPVIYREIPSLTAMCHS